MGSTLKNYTESGMKKAAFGAKVMTEAVALDSWFDVVSQRYSAGLVYAVGVCGVCERSTATRWWE